MVATKASVQPHRGGVQEGRPPPHGKSHQSQDRGAPKEAGGQSAKLGAAPPSDSQAFQSYPFRDWHVRHRLNPFGAATGVGSPVTQALDNLNMELSKCVAYARPQSFASKRKPRSCAGFGPWLGPRRAAPRMGFCRAVVHRLSGGEPGTGGEVLAASICARSDRTPSIQGEPARSACSKGWCHTPSCAPRARQWSGPKRPTRVAPPTPPPSPATPGPGGG